MSMTSTPQNNLVDDSGSIERIISIDLLTWLFRHAQDIQVSDVVIDYSQEVFPDKKRIKQLAEYIGITIIYLSDIKKVDSQKSGKVLAITCPRRSAKVRNNSTSIPPYNDGRNEFVEYFLVEQRLRAYAKDFTILFLTYPGVLFASDAATFRAGMLLRLLGILHVPYARVKYTSRSLYMLEFSAEENQGEYVRLGTMQLHDSSTEMTIEYEMKERIEFINRKWDWYFEIGNNSISESAHTIMLSEIAEYKKNVVDIFRGKNVSTSKTTQEILETIHDKTVVLSVSNIQDGRIIFENHLADVFEGSKRKDQLYKIKENDIILASKGTMPKAALVPFVPRINENKQGYELTEEALFEKQDLTARFINTYMPIDTYRLINDNSITMLANSSLLILRIEPQAIAYLFPEIIEKIEGQESINKIITEAGSYFMRYLCLVLRDRQWGYQQLQSLQKGGKILNLNPEKVMDLRVPRLSYDQLVHTVLSLEEYYYAIEKNTRNINAQMRLIERFNR